MLRQCLESLFAHPPSCSYGIIVVDDGSRAGVKELLATYAGRISVITHECNQGFASACNDGAAAASGEYVVFLNYDTIATPGWLDALVAYAAGNTSAAIVGSKLLFIDGTVQHAGVVICQDRIPRHIYAGFPADHPAVNKSRRFAVVSAACALVRSDAFRAAGGFDTAFLNGYEDVDLCLRLGEMGHEVHYCHESVLYHLESVSEKRWDHLAQNERLYEERWLGHVVPDDIGYYLEDGLLRISHGRLYPTKIDVAPELGVVSTRDRQDKVEQMLDRRAHQVEGLLARCVRLTVDLLEQTSSTTGDGAPGAHTPARRADGGYGSQRILTRGPTHRPKGARSSKLLSILVPVKNGRAWLPETLTAIRSQDTIHDFEIIGVDSGSTDGSTDILREFGATVIAIDPASFNHGLTRNFAASHASGEIIVFVNQSTLPADDHWLTNLVTPLFSDLRLAGVCSRVVPRDGADPLLLKDGLNDPSGSESRRVQRIEDRGAYLRFNHDQLRRFVNFHTVSCAIRPDVLARIPFRDIVMGEDVLWAKEVLEAGWSIQHEPSSVVKHSHAFSLDELFERNTRDGAANRQIVGRTVSASDVVPTIVSLVHDDWRYLRRLSDLPAEELETLRIQSVLRRTAQLVGQWMGVNHDSIPAKLMAIISETKALAKGETVL